MVLKSMLNNKLKCVQFYMGLVQVQTVELATKC